MYELIAVIAVTLVIHTWFVIAGKKSFKRTWYLIWRGVTAPFRFTFNLVRNNRVAVLMVLLVVGFAFFSYVGYDYNRRAILLESYGDYEYKMLSEAEMDAIGHWEPREDDDE